jgi:hypothetical protein
VKKRFSVIFLLMVLAGQTFGQVYTNKVVGEKNEELIDSLKTKPYPYALPILGAKAAARGYDLPYSAGVNVNYLWQKSDLIISDLYVGFNNGSMYNLDEIIRFDNSTAEAGNSF